MKENGQNGNVDIIRHSLAHLLAMAVLKKFPKAKLGIGPVIENGFYYDFKLPKPITDADLPELEATMRELIAAQLPIAGQSVAPAKAKKLFKDQPFKLELIKNFVKEKKALTAYSIGDERRKTKDENKDKSKKSIGLSSFDFQPFTDLCRGGHVANTAEINPDAFKLVSIAGAYWKGDEKNAQLTRVYGAAFATRQELDAHLRQMEEARKRDHRKLGKDLELFTIIDEVGPGLPLFYPNGAVLRRIVENYIAELQESRGYVPIWIPHITKGELYKISGHLDKYDAMYPAMKLKGEADYYLKPMNCPHFMMLYQSQPHSYRDLPVRYTATTTNYRYEKSGELSGLTRVRSLTQDDCHVFATPGQLEGEINLMLDMIAEVYQKFGFKDFWVRISTHDPKQGEQYIGDPKVWQESEAALARTMQKRGWKNETVMGEAAFYGPKLDFIFKDVIGREWQLSTIQLDMNLPKRFGLTYVGEDGQKQEPVVIHRAILGSTERFLGILIEHFAGAFPFWLAPVQVGILVVTDAAKPYAAKVAGELKKHGVRITTDERSETIGRKIREAELKKIPYLLVIGEREAREAKANMVAVRERGKGDQGQMALGKFMEAIMKQR